MTQTSHTEVIDTALQDDPNREDLGAGIKNFSVWAQGDQPRMRPAAEIPAFVQKKAALISAHFLLPAGARVIDMGCGTGEVTYALAKLNPRWGVIGFDRNPEAIVAARQKYRLPNLAFRVSDATMPDLEDDSVDGIVNSNMLHHIYSENGYNADEVAVALDRQMRKLKTGGTMLIRDYMLPSENDFVLLELPNHQSTGDGPLTLSDADLLVRFSQTARPMDNGSEGFFIEEQMPKREGTRLFRLPHKWALEFIHRKNYREKWDDELGQEYTFYNYQDFRRECARVGMRMVFSAPYWNPWVVKNCFQGRFQMYTEDGNAMPPPATNYFIVAQKVADKNSLALEERRPSQQPVGNLQIMIVRDRKSGELQEIVKRPGEFCDIVPYRITPDNRLLVYVRSGFPRPIVNAVNRGSFNLDGKKWSGHLIEPVTMDTADMGADVEENRRMIFDYMQSSTGLRGKSTDSWRVGDAYFPSPDRIDEAIEPVFIEVENPDKTNWQIEATDDTPFESGTMTELDAADIILASQVGLLPEPRLEMYVYELMIRHNIDLPDWVGENMPEIPAKKIKTRDPDDLLSELEPAEFEKPKQGAISLKAVKSVFVEERRTGRSKRALAAQDIEFVVTEDGIENIAVVLPVSRDWDDGLLVAVEPKMMSVPNRMGGDGAMLTAPSFVLPKDVRSLDEAKAFVAKQFGVKIGQVASLGESYFTHTGIMPQRVYPFTVAAAADPGAGRKCEYVRMKRLWKLTRIIRFSNDLYKAMARLSLSIGSEHDMSLNRELAGGRKNDYRLSIEKEAVDTKGISYTGVPSRILGQRPAAAGPAEISPHVLAETKLAHDAATAQRPMRRLSEAYAQAQSGLPVTARALHTAADDAPPPIKPVTTSLNLKIETLSQKSADISEKIAAQIVSEIRKITPAMLQDAEPPAQNDLFQPQLTPNTKRKR